MSLDNIELEKGKLIRNSSWVVMCQRDGCNCSVYFYDRSDEPYADLYRSGWKIVDVGSGSRRWVCPECSSVVLVSGNKGI